MFQKPDAQFDLPSIELKGLIRRRRGGQVEVRPRGAFPYPSCSPPVALTSRKASKPNLHVNIALVDRIAAGTTPIPGTRRVAYLEVNAAASDIRLTEAELESLDAAAPVHATSGDRDPAGIMRTLDG